MSAHGNVSAPDTQHLSKEGSKKLLRLGAIAGGVGVAIALAAAVTDSSRFAFSYLTAFMWLTTLGLGGLFFVMLQHLTKSGWSVGPRRQGEWLASVLPLTALLFVPVIFFAHDLFHHWMDPHALEDPIIRGKSGYLNTPFFYIRAALYFVVWILLSLKFTRSSLAQDKSGDVSLTTRLESLSAPGMVLFALTLTFAGFDWVMSLDPHWFSTIFGVYIFSGAVTGSLSVIALLMIVLQKKGLLSRISNVEHRHDVGKLLYGFTIFWAYIGFSQFFLIWYANMPEETIFFYNRWEGGWRFWTYLLIIGHFVAPLFILLSRHAKRSVLVLGVSSVWMLLMHWVDMYWLVMPTFTAWEGLNWIDIAAFLGIFGVLVFWISLRASKDALYPLKDPRLAEAAQLVNL